MHKICFTRVIKLFIAHETSEIYIPDFPCVFEYKHVLFGMIILNNICIKCFKCS